MKTVIVVVALLLLFMSPLVLGRNSPSDHSNHKRVRIGDISDLLFQDNAFTKGLSVAPIPQLTCYGDCDKKPVTVHCTNSGWDGIDVIWKCDAALPEGVIMTRAFVNCEGWDYPEDEYIVAGSCGLDYVLRDEKKSFSWLAIIVIFFVVIAVVAVCLKTIDNADSYYVPRSTGNTYFFPPTYHTSPPSSAPSTPKVTFANTTRR